MIDKGVFFGANRALTIAASGSTFRGAQYSTAAATLNAGLGRVWVFNSATADVTLPAANGDPTLCGRLGGPVFVVINIHSSDTITVKDNGGNTIQAVAPNKAVVLGLADNSTANGTWSKHLQSVA